MVKEISRKNPKKTKQTECPKRLVCSLVHEVVVELQHPEPGVLQYTESDDSRNIHDDLKQMRTLSAQMGKSKVKDIYVYRAMSVY